MQCQNDLIYQTDLSVPPIIQFTFRLLLVCADEFPMERRKVSDFFMQVIFTVVRLNETRRRKASEFFMLVIFTVVPAF